VTPDEYLYLTQAILRLASVVGYLAAAVAVLSCAVLGFWIVAYFRVLYPQDSRAVVAKAAAKAVSSKERGHVHAHRED
jgi:hypothetical protein